MQGDVDLDSFKGDLTALYELSLGGLPPPLLSIQPQTNGILQFQVFAPGQTQVIVQATDDLASWTNIASLAITNGPRPFSDPDAGTHSKRFYRPHP